MNNRSIKNIAVTFALIGFSSLTFATTTVLTVNGMVCGFCAQGIEKRLSKLPETKGVFVDLKKKIVAVEAKEGIILNKKMLQAEVKDAGYDVVKVEDIDQPLDAIKAISKGQK